MALEPRQIRFCEEYVVDHNGTQAAIRAGYSKKTANEQAARLLANVSVKAHIADLQEDLRNKTSLTAELIIEELRSLGFWSIKDFLDEDNSVTDLKKMTKAQLRPVVGIKVTETVIGDVREVKTELKMADKRASLVDLGRHLGIFKEDNKQKSQSAQSMSDSQFDKLLKSARETKTSKSK